MTSAIFKSTGAIIIYVISGLILLAIIGYNYWGWFQFTNPTDKRTSFKNNDASEGFPVISFPGDTYIKDGIKYTWTAITSDKSNKQFIQYAWLTDAQKSKGCGEY